MPSLDRYKKYVSDSFYHLYNRGVEKRIIFVDDQDYITFLRMCRRALTKRGPSPILVDLIAFCLMPNHYHFIIKQRERRGITRFIRSIASGYAVYFNEKYDPVLAHFFREGLRLNGW